LNAARGRTRNIMQTRTLEAPTRVLRAVCTCDPKSFFDFYRELDRLRLYSTFETAAARKSLDKLIKTLGHFTYTLHPGGRKCYACQQDYKNSADDARSYATKYFEGLCLDCISQPRDVERPQDDKEYETLLKRAEDSEYDGKDHHPEVWSEKCRVNHGEPTWYFSYCAREQERKFGPLTRPF
jgi:hypothetical protein